FPAGGHTMMTATDCAFRNAPQEAHGDTDSSTNNILLETMLIAALVGNGVPCLQRHAPQRVDDNSLRNIDDSRSSGAAQTGNVTDYAVGEAGCGYTSYQQRSQTQKN